MMLDLPRIGQAEGEAEISVPMSYRKYVEKHMTKIEKVLKLVGFVTIKKGTAFYEAIRWHYLRGLNFRGF